jgi:hypothetical protein
MNITKVSVTYGETQSLPEYCNVKLSVTLEAAVDGEEEFSVTDALIDKARGDVQFLVDEALEEAGKVAKYSREPRFKAMQSADRKCIVIVPNELLIKALPDDFTNVYGIPTGARMEHLIKLIKEKRPSNGVQVIDCSDCDLTRIPPLPEKQAEPEQVDSPFAGRHAFDDMGVMDE